MEKNNKFGAVLITAIVLIVLFGGILFIFNKQGWLSFSGEKYKVINNSSNHTLDKVEKNNNYIDFTKISDFKNYDGTYGSMETLNIADERGYNYLVVLYLNGVAKVYNPNYEKPQNINVNNIVQIIYFADDICYLLDKNGKVYSYDLTKSDNMNFDVDKVNNADDIVKLLLINYCPVKDGGCAASLIAIKSNGSYITLNTFRR